VARTRRSPPAIRGRVSGAAGCRLDGCASRRSAITSNWRIQRLEIGLWEFLISRAVWGNPNSPSRALREARRRRSPFCARELAEMSAATSGSFAKTRACFAGNALSGSRRALARKPAAAAAKKKGHLRDARP
jgi:hypothetical protein